MASALGPVGEARRLGKCGSGAKEFLREYTVRHGYGCRLYSDRRGGDPAPYEKMLALLETDAFPYIYAFFLAGLAAQNYYETLAVELDSGHVRYPIWEGDAAEKGPYARWRLTGRAWQRSRVTGAYWPDWRNWHA